MGQSVAVIGAGPMGLAVAYQLVRDGHHPIVFEADDRVGGQAASFDFDGLPIERFYHFHCTSDDAFLRILEELGIESEMRWVETKMGYYFERKIQPWGNPFALLKFSGLSLLSKFRYGLHVFLSIRRKNWKPLDKFESSVWLKRWVGKEAYEVLWEKLFKLKFYRYAHSTSAAWTWSRIRRIGLSRYNLFREKLGYLAGGSDTLLHPMRKYIEDKGGVFYLGCPVEKIVIENDSVIGVQSKRGFDKFEKVVSTMPLPYLPDILRDFPAAVIKLYGQVNYVAVVCVVAKLTKPISQNFWLNINDPAMDIPGLVEYSNLRSLDHHVVYAPYYIPGDHPKFRESDQAFQSEFKGYLKKINPALKDDDFLAMHVSRYQYAQPVCTPGFLDKLPPVMSKITGFWAADTSYYYPEDRGISESIAFGREMAISATKTK